MLARLACALDMQCLDACALSNLKPILFDLEHSLISKCLLTFGEHFQSRDNCGQWDTFGQMTPRVRLKYDFRDLFLGKGLIYFRVYDLFRIKQNYS